MKACAAPPSPASFGDENQMKWLATFFSLILLSAPGLSQKKTQAPDVSTLRVITMSTPNSPNLATNCSAFSSAASARGRSCSAVSSGVGIQLPEQSYHRSHNG